MVLDDKDVPLTNIYRRKNNSFNISHTDWFFLGFFLTRAGNKPIITLDLQGKTGTAPAECTKRKSLICTYLQKIKTVQIFKT